VLAAEVRDKVVQKQAWGVLKGSHMLNPDILRQSFDLVIDRRPDLTARFYEILFERYPALQPMFRRNARPAQEKMLAQALAAVLDHLEDASWLSTTLGNLGAAHTSYGVTDAMYIQVGDALLATLAEVAAEAWTAEVAAQWTAAYGAIASMMQAGARNAAVAA
jgi:hemoglobin-like flavoprotein